jgi:hypothetical protein
MREAGPMVLQFCDEVDMGETHSTFMMIAPIKENHPYAACGLTSVELLDQHYPLILVLPNSQFEELLEEAIQ